LESIPRSLSARTIASETPDHAAGFSIEEALHHLCAFMELIFLILPDSHKFQRV
jgi:hypothetical protein